MAAQEQVAAAGEEASSAAARQQDLAAEVERLQQVIRTVVLNAVWQCEQTPKVAAWNGCCSSHCTARRSND